MGMGMGAVWEKRTRGIPILNPTITSETVQSLTRQQEELLTFLYISVSLATPDDFTVMRTATSPKQT